MQGKIASRDVLASSCKCESSVVWHDAVTSNRTFVALFASSRKADDDASKRSVTAFWNDR
jgi:hypothetical protein